MKNKHYKFKDFLSWKGSINSEKNTFTFSGDELISFAVDSKSFNVGVDQNGKPLKNGVSNTGKIIANSGKILVTANVAKSVLDNAINMRGVAEAHSVSQQQNGTIVLNSGSGKANVGGKLIAFGKQHGEKIHFRGRDLLIH